LDAVPERAAEWANQELQRQRLGRPELLRGWAAFVVWRRVAPAVAEVVAEVWALRVK